MESICFWRWAWWAVSCGSSVFFPPPHSHMMKQVTRKMSDSFIPVGWRTKGGKRTKSILLKALFRQRQEEYSVPKFSPLSGCSDLRAQNLTKHDNYYLCTGRWKKRFWLFSLMSDLWSSKMIRKTTKWISKILSTSYCNRFLLTSRTGSQQINFVVSSQIAPSEKFDWFLPRTHNNRNCPLASLVRRYRCGLKPNTRTDIPLVGISTVVSICCGFRGS